MDNRQKEIDNLKDYKLLVNLMLDMMKYAKPSSYVMRIKMMSSITILKMSGECVQTLKNITSYWKKHS